MARTKETARKTVTKTVTKKKVTKKVSPKPKTPSPKKMNRDLLIPYGKDKEHVMEATKVVKYNKKSKTGKQTGFMYSVSGPILGQEDKKKTLIVSEATAKAAAHVLGIASIPLREKKIKEKKIRIPKEKKPVVRKYKKTCMELMNDCEARRAAPPKPRKKKSPKKKSPKK